MTGKHGIVQVNHEVSTSTMVNAIPFLGTSGADTSGAHTSGAHVSGADI
jgi:hypothetical protein